MPPPSPHLAGDPTPWGGWIFPAPPRPPSHPAYKSIVVSEYPAAHPLPHLPSPGILRLWGELAA